MAREGDLFKGPRGPFYREHERNSSLTQVENHQRKPVLLIFKNKPALHARGFLLTCSPCEAGPPRASQRRPRIFTGLSNAHALPLLFNPPAHFLGGVE